MTRSTDSERTRRLNAARELLQELSSNAQAAAALMAQFDISKRQAYRYIQEAQRAEEPIPIPASKIAFTVKLPVSLIEDLRKSAKITGETISEIVAQALEAFLHKGGRHGQNGQI